MFLEYDFDYFTEHYYSNTPRWENGANKFIELANHINSGNISLIMACSIYIGSFIINTKTPTYSSMNSIVKLNELSKFYSVSKTIEQFAYINKLMIDSVEDNIFAEFTENKTDVYKVNESQVNELYRHMQWGSKLLLLYSCLG